MIKDNRSLIGRELDQSAIGIGDALNELDHFLLLCDLGTNRKCDHASYQKLREYDDSEGGHNLQNPTGRLTRITRLLRQILINHAQSCKQINFDKFKAVRDAVDPGDGAKVAKAMDRLLSERNPLGWDSLARRDSIIEFHLPAIASMAQADHEKGADLIFGLSSKLYISSKSEAKVERLLNMYFFDPCLRYTSRLRDYFENVLFDAQMIDILEGLTATDEDKKDFKQTRDRYLLCKKAVGWYRYDLKKTFMIVIKTLGEKSSYFY